MSQSMVRSDEMEPSNQYRKYSQLVSLSHLISADKLEGPPLRIEESEKSMWDSIVSGPQEALDMIMDPNKKERMEEEKTRGEVKAAKKAWRQIRKERFAFLDNTTGGRATSDEKKTDN